MGEIAEMMLDGTLCEQCGTFMGDGDGFPTVCHGCAPKFGFAATSAQAMNPAKMNCPKCKKRIKIVGLSDHMRDAHKELK